MLYRCVGQVDWFSECSEELAAAFLSEEGEDHVALARLLSSVFRVCHEDEELELTRIWKDQIYFQIHGSVPLDQGDISLSEVPQRQEAHINEILRLAGMLHWGCRMTKHVAHNHAYTEFVLERRSSILNGRVPYSVSEPHGRLLSVDKLEL